MCGRECIAGPRWPTERDHLYAEAKRLGISGRSFMTTEQLRVAVAACRPGAKKGGA